MGKSHFQACLCFCIDAFLPTDHRILVSQANLPIHQHQENVMLIDPNFRVVVLANRPGFPFLGIIYSFFDSLIPQGNNFFKECGDLFSIHAVENPDHVSELVLYSC